MNILKWLKRNKAKTPTPDPHALPEGEVIGFLSRCWLCGQKTLTPYYKIGMASMYMAKQLFEKEGSVSYSLQLLTCPSCATNHVDAMCKASDEVVAVLESLLKQIRKEANLKAKE